MAESKSVLVLIGDMEDLSREESYWNSMRKINSNITITYCSIQDFEKGPPENNYDSIIIWGHGAFKDAGMTPSGKKHRKDHHMIDLNKKKSESKKTSKLVEFCSKYSKKILVTTCFAGALMKDLQTNPVEADVVALGGSKHITLRHTSDLLEITKKFIQDGVRDLIEFASPVFLDTFQIQNKDKNITKLSTIKINQAHSNLTRILCTPKPSSVPLESKENKKNSWWIENQVRPVKDLGQSDKNRLLGIAIAKSKIEDVLFWLLSGADPNATLNFFGVNPIYYAAELGHLDVVKTLLAHNANPNQARSDGITPLYVAAELGHLDVVKTLLAHNANPNQARSDGITPLYVAAELGHLDVVKTLLDKGAKSNIVSSGATPLIIANQKGHLDVIKVLKDAIEKAAAEKAAAEKAAAEKAAAEKAAAEKAAAEKAAAEKAAAEKAAAEKAAAEKALVDKERVDKGITSEQEKECDLIVKDLLKLTLEYQKRVKVDFIKHILTELLSELNANKASTFIIQGFYTILASQNSRFCRPNIDVIKKDDSRSSLNFIAGIGIILVSLATLPISVFILGAIYHKTNRHPLDLFKTEGERLIKELKLIKEKNILRTNFFKPAEEKKRSYQEPVPVGVAWE